MYSKIQRFLPVLISNFINKTGWSAGKIEPGIYTGAARFLRQIQRILFLRITLITMVYLLLSSGIFSIVYVFTGGAIGARVIWLVSVFCLILRFIYTVSQMKEKSLSKAQNIYYRVNNASEIWMKYSPRVMIDIENKNFVQHQNTSEAFAYRAHLEQKAADKTLPAAIGWPATLDFFIKLSDYIASVLLVLILGLLLVTGTSFFDVAFKYNPVLPATNNYTLSPDSGRFFRSEPLMLQVKTLNDNLEFKGFEVKAQQSKDYTAINNHETLKNNLYQHQINNLSENFQYRAVFVHRFRKVYSETKNIRVLDPSDLSDITFEVIPPHYTGTKPYKTGQNILRVFNGSRIKVAARAASSAQLKLVSLNQEHKADHYKMSPELNNSDASETVVFSTEFIFNKQNRVKMHIELKDIQAAKTFTSMSPVYEIWPAQDKKPTIKLLADKSNLTLRLPDYGEIEYQYHCADDYGFKPLEVAVISGGKVIDTLTYRLKPHAATEGNERVYMAKGTVKVNTAKYRGHESILLATSVRDNSFIYDRLPWQKRSRPGQTAVANPVSVFFASDNNEKEEWQQNNTESLASELAALSEQFRQSEEQLKDILEKAARGDSENSEEELKRWSRQREAIQKAIAKKQKQIQNNINTQTQLEDIHKKNATENLSSDLDKKISEKEQELKNLMQNFPQDFVASQKKMEQLSRKEYIDRLENSINNLKKLLLLKKLRNLTQKIDESQKQLSDVQKQAAMNHKQASTLEKKSKEFKDKISELNRKAESFSKELQQQKSTSQMQAQMQPEDEQQFGESMQSMQQNLKDEKTAEAIKNASKAQQALENWRTQLMQVRKKLGEEEMKKALNAFKITAFRINEMAEIWQRRSHEAGNAEKEITETELRQYENDLSILRSSFNAVLLQMVNEAGPTGFLSVETSEELKQTYKFFDSIQNNLEQKMINTFRLSSQRLRYKFNRSSLLLLKEMSRMKGMMAQVGQGDMSNSMQQAGQMTQEMQQTLKEMGEKQGQKEGELNAGEQAYLNELKRQQQALEKRIEQQLKNSELAGSSVGKDARQAAKEMKELQEQMKQVKNTADLNKLEEKTRELSEKLLNAKKAMKNKKEKTNEREAQRPSLYEIPAHNIEPLKNEKRLHIPAEMFEDLSVPERTLYKNYMQNLDL